MAEQIEELLIESSDDDFAYEEVDLERWDPYPGPPRPAGVPPGRTARTSSHPRPLPTRIRPRWCGMREGAGAFAPLIVFRAPTDA